MRTALPLSKPFQSACCLLFGLFAALAGTHAQQKSPVLKPVGYVNDFANVLSQSTKFQLTALCTEVDQKAHAQIAVVIVQSLGGRSIEDFSIELATKWGIGPKQSERGVMILLAVEDRRYRFEIGYGLESILPDGKTGAIGREAVPYLREGNYDAAVLLMTQRVADVIAQDRGVVLTVGTSLPPPRKNGSGRENQSSALWQILLPLAIIAFMIYAVIKGASRPTSRRFRGGGWWMGPMMGGGGWGGGGFGGGGGGGGGFGGFGGGSFGGGGASGSW
ncbi:MAG TPA: TPM domain-containing protein [Candidatus Limnocylindria bacterium]|nr:TPM domain-containing protein [Candidatus Limnocylindria bacterium]